MKKYLFVLLYTCLVLNVFAQGPLAEGAAAAPVSPVAGALLPDGGKSDSASFFLHKFAQNIGREKYVLTVTDSGLVYSIQFKFTDRGSAVPLKAVLRTTPASEPLALTIKGSTSRFSMINDSIRIQGSKAYIRVDDSAYSVDLQPLSFPVGGYSPWTVQMILLQYWKNHHHPATIHLLPVGSVQIKKDGYDTLQSADKPLVLERYVISGLVWGNELVWTDRQGKLICLITNDAEGDKLEMMSEPYEAQLPDLIKKAAGYGMRLFTRAVGKSMGARPRRLAIVGGNLVDPLGRPTLKNSVILIEDGLIKQTGKAGEIAIPAGVTVIHAEGSSILPGLWDMHAHFEQAEWGPAYLAAGVTTVRDCGNEYEYINAIQQAIDGGKGIGPHILKAGIIDGPGPMGLGVIRAGTAAEAVTAVQRYKNNGFVQIKIYSSVTPEIVKVICDEAHRQGLTVTGHIPEGMTLQAGVDSGMDMVNHIQYVSSVMKLNKDRSIDLNDSTNRAVLQFVRDHHVVIDPTLGVFEMIFRSTKDDITDMEPAFYSLPLPLQALFRTMGMPPANAEKFKPLMVSLGKIVKALEDSGVQIVAGTDMGFPGNSVYRELELYVDAGLTPLQAIQTATIVPARVMKMERDYGSLDAGKKADLIIVDGDPLTNIRDIRKVRKVIRDGQVYDPALMHKLAGFAK